MNSDAELYYGMTRERLRSWVLWAGAILCFSPLVPHEVVSDRPQFLWQLFAELPTSAVIAALAPALAGTFMLLFRWRCQRSTSLAVATIGVLAGVFVLRSLGSDAAAWTLLPLPPSFVQRTTAGLMALALSAASADLTRRPETKRAARYLLVAAALSGLFFYVWPDQGIAPGVAIAYQLAALPDMPTLGHKLGTLTLAIIALWPALMVGLGLMQLRRPSRLPVSPVSMLALFGFPAMLLMLLLMLFLRSNPGGALFGALGTTAELVAVLIALAAAFGALGHLIEEQDADDLEPPGWTLIKTVQVSVALLLFVGAAQWWLSRPPAKGVTWQLGPGSAEADNLYGRLIVNWSDARWSWDRQVRRDSSASALIEVKNRGRKMLAGAEQQDAALATALNAMADAGAQLDTSARRWFRLVGEVNAASRNASLPYYLDPRISITKSKEGLRRHLLIDSYRVERSATFHVNGAPYGVLHVRAFGAHPGAHNFGLLGFSRDQQPFALVVTESTRNHISELRAKAKAEPPACEVTFEPERHDAMLRCGSALKEWLSHEDAPASVIGLVERHELQHQIDGPLLPMAGPLLKKLAGYAEPSKKRVNRELSAYVAELTSRDADPHLGLIVPLQFAIMRDRGTYHHAAILAFEALVERKLRDARGRPDHAALNGAFAELADLDDDNLRARARMAWSELFGGTLPDVKRVETFTSPTKIQ